MQSCPKCVFEQSDQTELQFLAFVIAGDSVKIDSCGAGLACSQ